MENKIATRVNLERHGVSVESSLCCLCGREEETYCHLFFDCSFAWKVWSFCFRCLGVSFVSHNDPLANFSQFRMNTCSESINDLWSTIWVGVVEEIWLHGNSIIFKRRVADMSEVYTLMQVKVRSWISVKLGSATVPFSCW